MFFIKICTTLVIVVGVKSNVKMPKLVVNVSNVFFDMKYVHYFITASWRLAKMRERMKKR